MAKYILSYDEADVEAGRLKIDEDGCLKGISAGDSEEWTFTMEDGSTVTKKVVIEQ